MVAVATAYDTVVGFRPKADVRNENWDYTVVASNPVTETPVSESSDSKIVTSRIRVLLSRPLTWAEKEDLETDWNDPHQRRVNGVNNDLGVKIHVANNFEHVWAEGLAGSRVVFDLIAAILESEYVNVFPRAVRTFREYNGE